MTKSVDPFLSLVETGWLIKEGKTSSVEVTAALLERIATIGQNIKAYAMVLGDRALTQARARDEELKRGLWRGPLHGIPIAIKDMIYTKGIATGSGTMIFKDWKPDYDSTIVRRLDDAGAVTIGKTQLTEAATGAHHPAIEVPVNPWNAAHTSGMSSSGSGAGVAAGLCFAALGSDTAGSIRVPAAVNGVTGLKPTWGRVTRHGVLPAAEFLDTIGPLARSAADAAAMLGVIAGADPLDPTASTKTVPNYLAGIEAGVGGLVIGFDEKYVSANTDPAIVEALRKTAETLVRVGAKIRPVTMPDIGSARFLAMFFIGMAEGHREIFPARAAEYGPDLARLLGAANTVKGIDAAASLNAVNNLKGQLQALFDEIDILLVPAIPMKPPKAGAIEASVRDRNNEQIDAFHYTMAFSASGSPSITLPGGFSEDGLPLAVQFVGRHFDEMTLFRAAHAFQQRSDWHLRRPPIG